MFESSGFRRMVAPHLPIKPGGKALGLARDDDDEEGWEAMAMRDELTDVMLHNAFGDAILKEVGGPAGRPAVESVSFFCLARLEKRTKECCRWIGRGDGAPSSEPSLSPCG